MEFDSQVRRLLGCAWSGLSFVTNSVFAKSRAATAKPRPRLRDKAVFLGSMRSICRRGSQSSRTLHDTGVHWLCERLRMHTQHRLCQASFLQRPPGCGRRPSCLSATVPSRRGSRAYCEHSKEEGALARPLLRLFMRVRRR